MNIFAVINRVIPVTALLILISTMLLVHAEAAANVPPGTVISIETLGEHGYIDLSRGSVWFFEPGDHPGRAEPEFYLENFYHYEWRNSRYVRRTDALTYMGDLPGSYQPGEISWFFTSLHIDSAFTGNSFGLFGKANGALDIFLNGRHIGSVGQVGSDPGSEIAAGLFPPIHFNIEDAGHNVLAFRFSNHVFNRTVSAIGPALKIGPSENILAGFQRETSTSIRGLIFQSFSYGASGVLGLLFIFLFILNPRYRLQLIGAVFFFSFTINVIFILYVTIWHHPQTFLDLISYTAINLLLYGFLNLWFTHELIGKKLKWLMWFSLATVLLITIVILLVDVMIGLFLASVFHMILIFIALILFIRARIRQKDKDLNVILGGYLIYYISFIVLITLFAAGSLTEAEYTVYVSVFSIALPIAYTFYIARDTARNNILLERKLEENDRLARENLEREQEQKRLIESRKDELEAEVTRRTAELQESLLHLRNAQEQLVQQEKLASLGQLTAGIAHEIKNPLNFVTNFSEVSLEMIDEAKVELESLSAILKSTTIADDAGAGHEMSDKIGKGAGVDANTSGKSADIIAALMEIYSDVKSNLGKIHEHGSRADRIVKSMLMHSRGGSGTMEPGNLNRIVKEYVNLTYHGMRAGPNPINVDINMELDDAVGEVPLIVEDFTRVIINLCNNAFDACAERSRSDKTEHGIIKNAELNQSDSSDQSRKDSTERGESICEELTHNTLREQSQYSYYMPRLEVHTSRTGKSVKLEIRDNGTGMPDHVKAKILEPFFTTKKGTEGTGLGLSITHDIIKAHGGRIEIESTPGSGSAFIITLPG